MPRKDTTAPFSPAPRSIDMVRVIRRCLRCYFFGAMGLVPLAGVGLAVQALRLRRQVEAELGESKPTPWIVVYSLVGVLLIWALDGPLGGVGDLSAWVILVLVQSWNLWHALAPRGKPGHPGWRHLL